jgi:CotH kinase protein
MAQAPRSAGPGAVLAFAVLGAAGFCMAVGREVRSPIAQSEGPLPHIYPELAYVGAGDPITVRATRSGALWYDLGNDPTKASATDDEITVRALPGSRSAARILATPTAIQWRRSLPGLPEAVVIRAAEGESGSGPGPFVMRTFLFEQHRLPVLSISTAEDGLFSAETGIAVPGHAMLYAEPAILASYANDPRWWKYPGNYHGRGSAWERTARMQLIGTDGRELLQTDVDLRINGQMTRGFPQHAFRLLFREPLAVPPFADGDGQASTSLVLRAAGNDQVKAMMRDAYQHALCGGLPFETSKARTCVVYINGAYFGVHHIRQRFDEEELARRFGIPTKRLALLEDQNVLCWGDSSEPRRFSRLMGRTEKWDGTDPAWLDTLEAQLDVDGYLTYMASQMLLGNMDWPRQNVKYWRYTGKPKAPPLDGRWRFIMGDSDLGFGANAPPSTDLFLKVRDAHAPVSRLFLAMMRNKHLKQRFVARAQALLDGPLSSAKCAAKLDSMVAAMEPEMERHTARWRKPVDKQAWLAEVDVMRHYAAERAGHARKQLAAYAANEPGRP